MNYNDYKLFIWNKDNIQIFNDNNIYENVKIHTGTVIKGQWENSIASCQDKIIGYSNSFLTDREWDTWYDDVYKIYSNISRNYLDILNNNVKINEIDDDELYFYMINAFNFSNSGHDLSTILNFAHVIRSCNIKNILILKNYMNQPMFKLIRLLLNDDINFVELNINEIYKFKKVMFVKPYFYEILKHPALIDELNFKIKSKYDLLYENVKNKNLILMKTNRNKNVMNKSSMHVCESFLQYFEKKDFINIIPEELDVFELCIYLQNAKKIICSMGSVIYTNKIFINPNTKVLLIRHDNLEQDGNGIIFSIKNLKFFYIHEKPLNDKEIIFNIEKIIDEL